MASFHRSSGPTLRNPTFCFLGGVVGTGGGGRGREAPRRCLLWFQVPAACEDDAASLPEQEWGSLDSRQKELCRIMMKGNYEAVVSLGEDQSLLTCQTHYHPLG